MTGSKNLPSAARTSKGVWEGLKALSLVFEICYLHLKLFRGVGRFAEKHGMPHWQYSFVTEDRRVVPLPRNFVRGSPGGKAGHVVLNLGVKPLAKF